MKRRNLSGIYIFDKFPEEENHKPTCLEDCQKETREKWLETLDKSTLITTIEHLCKTIRYMSDEFNIIAE